MAGRSRSPRFRSLIVGISGLAVITVVLVFGITASSGVPGTPKTMVRAAFDNVGASLKVGDDLRENGVRIGRVAALDYDGRRAVATLQINGSDVPVYSDAHAAVDDTSALAKKYVEFDPGHPQAGPLGDRIIPENRNIGSGDLDQVLNVLDPQTRDALTSTIRQTGGGVAGHSQDLHDVLEHAGPMLNGAGNISSALSTPNADLPALLNQANQLAGSLNGHEKQLSSLVSRVDSTMRAVDVDKGQPLQQTVNRLPATLTAARNSFDQLNRPLDDTRVALVNLRPGVADLGRATPDLRGVLKESREPLNRVPGVSAIAQPAISDLTKTVSDARPLVPPVSRALQDAANPINTLADYSDQVMEFFRNLESMTSTEVSPGVHGARVLPAVGGGSVAGGGVLPHELEGQDPYPAPGQADREHTNSPLNLLPGGNHSGGNH